MKCSTIIFRDAYSFPQAFLTASMISSAVNVWPDSNCGRVHPWQFGAQTHESPPTHSWLLGGSQTLHFHSAYFPLTQTDHLSVGVGKHSLLCKYRFESHDCTVEWNRYCSIQTRSSSFCLFTLHKCGFLAVIFIINVYNMKYFSKTLRLQLWVMRMVFIVFV